MRIETGDLLLFLNTSLIPYFCTLKLTFFNLLRAAL